MMSSAKLFTLAALGLLATILIINLLAMIDPLIVVGVVIFGIGVTSLLTDRMVPPGLDSQHGGGRRITDRD